MAILAHTVPLQRRHWLGLLFILLLAAVLRLDAIQYNHFRADEADLSSLAQGIVAGAGRPLLGLGSSVGIPNSPASDYIMAVPYFFSNDPMVATGFVAAWNVLGVGLLWWLACRVFDPTVAFFAGLIYAVSPWAVWYSSKIWIQFLHTPLVLLSLLLGVYGYIEGNRWAQVFFLPVFILALQIHFATWALLPLFPVLVWAGRRQLSWRALAVSLVLAGAVLYPFFAGVEQNGMAGGVGSGIFGRISSIPSHLVSLDVRLQPLTYNAWFSTGLGMTSVISYYKANEMTASLPTIPLLWLPLGLFAVLGSITIWKMTHAAIAALVYLWVALPVAVFIPNWTRVVEDYFVASIPALCLLTSVGLTWLLHRLPCITLSRILIGGGVGIILLSQIIWWHGLLHYIDVTALPEQGTPLHYIMDIRRALMKSNDVLLALDGSRVTAASHWKPMFFRTTECVRPPMIQKDDAGLAVLPEAPFVVLTAPDSPKPILDGLYTNSQMVRFSLRPGEGAYTVYTFDRRPEWNGPALQTIAPARFDNGIQLTGYDFQGNRLYLRWEITSRPDRDYQYFAHLLNAAGEKIAQRDTAFYNRYSLCRNDQIITWVDLPRPAGAVTLRVGMYTFTPQGYNNSVLLDEHGNRGLSWIDIPLSTE